MITGIDHSILLWIQNNLRFEWLTPFWKGMTLFGEGGYFWIALCIILLCIKKTRKIGMTMTFALIINVLIVNLGVKNVVCRVRPYDQFSDLTRLIEAQKDWSFPSGHTSACFACSFAMWVACEKKWKKWAIALIVLSCFVGFSRLYLGVHFPSDVLCGALIGIVAACISNFVVRKVFEKNDKKRTV